MNFISRLLGKHSHQSTNSTPDKIDASDLIQLSIGKSKTQKSVAELQNEVANLPYNEDLVTLASTEGKLQGSALRHIAALLDTNESNLRQIRNDIPTLSHQLTIASFSNTPLILDTILSDISDETALVDLCENTPTSAVRIKLLDKIHSYEALKSLEKTLKHKDKTCLKRIKAKLDSIRTERAKKTELEKKQIQLLQELSDHSTRPFNNEYKAKYENLQRKVSRLGAPSDSSWFIDAHALLDACKTRLDSQPTTEDTNDNLSKDQEKTKEPAPSKIDYSLAQSYCEHINLMLNPELDFDAIFKLQETQENLASQCDITYGEIDDGGTLISELKSLSEAVESYLFLIKEDQEFKFTLKHLTDKSTDANHLQDSIRQVNRAKSQITNNTAFKRYVGLSHLCILVNEKQKELEDIEKKEQEKNRQIVSLIRKGQFALKSGRLKQAQGIKKSISELLEIKPYLPSYLERQWMSLLEDISELSDWHTYASVPKLQSLMKDMQQLVDTPEAPELQATKIKRIQDEWKSVSKGSAGKHQELWDEFKSISDKAYVICEEHYAQLDEERQENAIKSDALIKQLELYLEKYSWSEANWSDVENVLISAKNEWHKYKPLPKSKHNQLKTAFNKKVDAIQSYLNDEYEKNREEKTRLVSSLKALVESKDLEKNEDLQLLIETTLNHQQQWKKIGRCQRREDQALWRSFRDTCDLVFQKRDEKKAQVRELTDTSIKEAESLISELDTIYSSEIANFKASLSEIDTLRAKFNAIENIPEKIQNALSRKFDKTRQNIEERNKNIDKEKKNSDWLTLYSYKKDILSAQSEQKTEQVNALIEALQSERLNSSCTKAVVNAVNKPIKHKLENNEAYYRLLCIKTEVFTDAPSPEKDKALRMQFQVEQLQTSFGEVKQGAQGLAEEWLSGPLIEPEAYNELASRFIPRWQTLKSS